MKLVFMGTPAFAVPTLEHLVDDGYEIAAVYTQPDREAGRGRSLVSSPVKKAAEESVLPVMQPDKFTGPGVAEQLADFQPDAIVVFAFGQRLPQPVLDIAPLGCINVHPSLLPKHRGAAPVIAAILAGDGYTGVTVMKMAEKLDAGDILLQGQIPVTDYDTTDTLTEKLSLVAAQLVLEVLPRLAKGGITPRTQDDSKASYVHQLTKRDGEIDWNLPAVDIWRRVRAFTPWPGCFTYWKGKQLKIVKAIPLPAVSEAGAGQVVALGGEKAAFGIGTGDGILGVLEAQLEGKKTMPADEFLRGQKQLIGERLPS